MKKLTDLDNVGSMIPVRKNRAPEPGFILRHKRICPLYFTCDPKHGAFVKVNKIAKTLRTDTNPLPVGKGHQRWYGCWFYEDEECYVDLVLYIPSNWLCSPSTYLAWFNQAVKALLR